MLLTHRQPTIKSWGVAIFVTSAVVIFYESLWQRALWQRLNNYAFALEQKNASTPALPSPSPDVGIPRKIWYKLGPRGLTGLNDDSRGWIDSCLRKNPEYKAEFLTDVSAEVFVKDNFQASRPDIVQTYLALSVPILKADFLRYLILYSHGGIWTDLDISCEDTPIRDWIPPAYKQNTSIVVGWEFDYGLGKTGTFLRQFASWTIMAKPRSPHMLMVIDDIMASVKETAEKHKVAISELKKDQVGDVVDFTGPRRLTRSVMKSLAAVMGAEVQEEGIANILEPKQVRDVLILPGYSFAKSMQRYEPETKQDPVFVIHHYAGSWKNELGGENPNATKA